MVRGSWCWVHGSEHRTRNRRTWNPRTWNLRTWNLERGTWNLVLLDCPKPFRHLDVRSPGIFDERDGDPEFRHFRVGTIELDAVGFELLRERLEVLHLEADVIQRAAGRADGRRR